MPVQCPEKLPLLADDQMTMGELMAIHNEDIIAGQLSGSARCSKLERIGGGENAFEGRAASA